jgi:NAD(P)-dependent dehydrogenase (short-subunit alcohol dehydrogenase family)
VTGPRFAGKVVLVTGGSSGLGLAAARAFAEEGADVIVAARDRTALGKAVAGIGGKAAGHQVDVSRVKEIEQLMHSIRASHGRLDVLFANAGIGRLGAIGEVTEALWDEVMSTNLKGVYFTVQQALLLMDKGASIVLNASVAADIGAPESSVYSASKAAVRSLGRSLGAELVGRGSRVNVVSPGPIDTPIFDKFGIPADAVGEFKKSWADDIPMKRFGSADEVARAVLFLASSEASYITGVELLVDGGRVSF